MNFLSTCVIQSFAFTVRLNCEYTPFMLLGDEFVVIGDNRGAVVIVCD